METMFGQGYLAATAFFIVLGLFQLAWIRVLLKSSNPSLLSLHSHLLHIGERGDNLRRSPTAADTVRCSHQGTGNRIRPRVTLPT